MIGSNSASPIAAIAHTIAQLRPDWVINAGAFTEVDAAEVNEARALAINAQAPRAIAKSLSATGWRLLQISSDYIFEGTLRRPYRVTDCPNPLSVYGWSKLLAEQGVGENALILRTGWLYAAQGRNFVHSMLDRMAWDGEVRAATDQLGTPTWVGGLAEALWRLIELRACGIHHYRDSGVTSWHEFARSIAEDALTLGLLGAKPRVIPITADDYDALARRPAYSVLDDSITRAQLKIGAAHWRTCLRFVLEDLASMRRCDEHDRSFTNK
ncbi:MAG: dTDP-4-dehydrorhamnose reductase [Erythrobacter sp.]